MLHPAAAARSFSLQFKNGDCDLLIRSFTGEEAVSRLFRFQLLAQSRIFIPASSLLGQDVAFTIELRNCPRRFLAKISSVDELGVDEHGRHLYGIELVPRIWAMTRTVRARIFEDLDALDIVKAAFSETEASVLIDRRPDSQRARPYCVQYFESDFDFAARLLEEEGYIYLHGADGVTPTVSIRHFPSTFETLGPLPFDGASAGPEERVITWKKARVLTATAVTARDHLFQASAPLLEGNAGLDALGGETPGWEPLDAGWSAPIERYPGEWAHLFEEVAHNGGVTPLNGYVDLGAKRAWRDLQQAAGWTSAAEGTSNCHRLAPGYLFELAGHPAWPGKHFIVSVRHKGTQAADHSLGRVHHFSYENEFAAVPYAGTMMYLPPRVTRKPVIHGCQTARVVGPDGVDEIWTDKYGRVQVEFWWDGEGKHSCWVRVATPWAGSHWGIQHVPRIGQEVVVAFLDGDPDRPLIVGSVYNPAHMPPFELTQNKTRSGIRTHSTPQAEAGESNEISFEDARGREEIYIHAQKDRTAVVEDTSRELVGNDRYDMVENDFHAATAGEKREAIGGKSHLTVGGDSMNAFLNNLGIGAGEIHLKAGKIVIEADTISIRTTDKDREFIQIERGGGITIESKGQQVWMNCGGAGSPEEGCFKEPEQPENPFAPKPPDPAA